MFKTAWFVTFARRQKIGDDALLEAVERANRGPVDADLGGGVIKQRIARPGQGRSGGYRTLILSWAGDRAIFASGFAKKDRDNLDPLETRVFRLAAPIAPSLSDEQLNEEVRSGRFLEIRVES